GLALAVAVAAAPAAASPSKTQPAIVLNEDSRSLVSARVGLPIEIRLRAQSGTGFSWIPTRPVPGLTSLKPVSAKKSMPGSAQVQRFRFVASAPGTYRLSFSYDQPWKGGTKGARTKGFIIFAR
ncbi:MAG: protease inhibitor I42 family protein, partial [Alphaproteobacteria bacterium]